MIHSLMPWRLSLPAMFGRRRLSWSSVKGRVLYAIGDIHGRSDCLSRAHALIDADRERANTEPSLEIYLGDFVDRGPRTQSVIDQLLARSKAHDVILLRGNHEVLMLEYLEQKLEFGSWRRLGGAETLMSYGARNVDKLSGTIDQQTLALIPEEHVTLLRNLHDYFVIDQYCFVHAGLRPHVQLQRQSVSDLTRIRDDFLKFRGDFGYTVVHGHTPVAAVDFRANRINIDTGAYLTSRLSVLKIDANGPALLGSV